MKTWNRRIIVVMATLLLAAAASKTVKASCYGTSCFDLDPYAQGCVSDAYNAQSTETDYIVVVLRYSPSCGSKWTVVDDKEGGYHHFYGETYSTFLETEEEIWNTTSIWTNMVCGVCGTKCGFGALGPANQPLNHYATSSPCS